MKKTISHAVLIAVVLMVFRAEAQNIPSFHDIIDKVRINSLPLRNYDVEIMQTIDAPVSTSIGASIASGGMQKQNTFHAVYTPTNGLYLDTVAFAQQLSAQNAPQPSVNPQGADLKVTFDLRKIFESADEWKNVRITKEDLNGIDSYLITGEYKIIDFKIWVNAAEFYASRLVMNIKGQKFSETDIHYERVEKQYWLPSAIVIRHSLDGSQVTQRLGKYQFQ